MAPSLEAAAASTAYRPANTSVTLAHDGRYGPAGERKGTIPVKFSKPDTSPLTATVKAGKNEFILEAKSE